MRRGKLKKTISKCLVAAMTIGIMAVGDMGCLVSEAGQRENAVALAAQQVGYHEKASNANLDDYTANSGSGNYTKYARDLGVGNGQAWCAYFVWWVMANSGVDSSAYPRSGWVPTLAAWFQNAGLYKSSGGSYVPNPGDYVFFGYSGFGHVGLVEYVADGYVHTIEGNSSDQVIRRSYNLYNSTYMRGFGAVNYSPSDTTKPVVTDVKVVSQTADSYTVQCTATDDTGVTSVQFPSWTENNGQDDIQWTAGTGENGVYTYTVKTSDHGNEEGVYNTHIYAYDAAGNHSDCMTVQVTMDRTAPTFSVVQIRDVSSEGFKLQFRADDNLSGVARVGCLAYTSGDEASVPDNWYELQSNFASKNGDDWEYYVSTADHGNAHGSYDVKLLAYDNSNNVCEYIIENIEVPSPETPATDTQTAEPEEGTEQPTDQTSEEPITEPTDATGTDAQPQTSEEIPADDISGTEDNSTANIVIQTNDIAINVENNYTTIVNNYISDNVFVEDGIIYTAESIPVLNTVQTADTEAPSNVAIAEDNSETVEDLMDANTDQALAGALSNYFANCYQSEQAASQTTVGQTSGGNSATAGTNVTAASDQQAEAVGYEPTELVNTLTGLDADVQTEDDETSKSLSLKTKIDGRDVTFQITITD